ncbi:MAG: filamentous hemagglutinin N-terminal domain-containing protein, partial [Gammaproteobacteria bacterium]|nr:filamentous hemagglutinin N-terminal domain-containing protein [Gammaproteobacteria bacterium]
MGGTHIKSDGCVEYKEARGRGWLRSSTALSGWAGALPAIILGAGLIGASQAYANPKGGNVVAGSAEIIHSAPNTVDIIQKTDKAAINWTSFSIDSSEITNFQQPSSSSIALNRVIGGNESKILGTLTANGIIWLLNPNGVFFGQNATVDVAGMLATTLDISDQDFMAGKYDFSGPTDSNAMVINQGMISVADGGLVALVAPGVENSGVISARLGRVALASGDAFTLDLYGDQLISLAVDGRIAREIVDENGEVLGALVSNSGQITAEGGSVMLSVAAAQDVVDNVINMSGIIVANTVVERNGEIVLMGGDAGVVAVSGTLQASGDNAGETGGTVKVLGEKVGLFGDAHIDVSGDAGGGTVLIGGDYQGGGSEPLARRTYVGANATINASAGTGGDGGTVIVWAEEVTRFYGTIEAKGGSESGDGGFVEVSGKASLDFAGLVDTSAPNGEVGTLLLDPTNIIVVKDGDQDTDDLGDVNAFNDP